jgi:uncharacterized protein YndB with AHSA1/START domain
MIGETKDAGYQIGVSKTLPFPIEQVWGFLTSREGVELWLGKGVELGREKGERYETGDGTTGEIRSFHDHDRVRLTWQPADWDHSTTVQIAVTSQGDKTTLTFHQEWLSGPQERERQRDHWRAVMTKLTDALD